jgi:hypothetical protein
MAISRKAAFPIGLALVVVALTPGLALAKAGHTAASSFTLNFPAGEACSFALEISGTGGNNKVHHEGNGMIVSAGTGSALTFSGDGNSVSFSSNGGAMLTRMNPDGSYTLQMTGHNVLILFPTDTPAGPSTTLIVGRATVSVSADGTYTVLRSSGRQVDICARLAS